MIQQRICVLVLCCCAHELDMTELGAEQQCCLLSVKKDVLDLKEMMTEGRAGTGKNYSETYCFCPSAATYMIKGYLSRSLVFYLTLLSKISPGIYG